MDDIQKRFFLALAAMWIAVLLVQPFTKVTVSYNEFYASLLAGFLVAGSGYLLGRMGLNLFRSIASVIAGQFLIMLPMVTANYMAMSLNMPLADDLLIRMDQALGFDWHSFIAFVDARPLLAGAFGKAYQSFLIQTALVPVLLLFLGYHRRAHAFMIAYGLLTLLAAVVAVWFPAYGTYTVYGYAEGQLANINAYFGFEFINHFEAVRSSETFQVSSKAMSGILTFPSVHAGVAYLLIWATWSNIWLRYPFLVLNLAMALSAVVNANHYLVDIVASVPLAAICVVAVNCLFGRSSRPHDASASLQSGIRIGAGFPAGTNTA
ncbi:phosphatase PAP2 family protein [Hoeflea sp. YIM 152468]|uniref:phosphatase PAP2 family protein n=1 Tax=Hoeflea sp. YIM 152468 TaxID=3031759 RepID=UPI0023DB389B|nr:phosphatase PAP2 family protein [Hoeflea sp. YIM 152468]MDF1610477.1 phosphatase PAP2 family protein [Hoeflea sp. YIM 152468]